MTKSSRSSNTPLVVAGVVILVLVLAVIAVLATSGSSNEPDESGVDPRLPALLRSEVRPIELEGAPLPAFASEGQDLARGMRPPLLVGEDITGRVHTVSPDIEGSVLLVFLAHWCPACNQEVPVLVDLAASGQIPPDLKVYAVLTAMEPGRPGFPASRWLTDFGWPFETIMDEPDLDRGPWKAAEAFGLTSFPYLVAIKDGVVVDRWSGASPAELLAARIAAVS
jgi:thiol-disulfide isomerase/thioredoxin